MKFSKIVVFFTLSLLMQNAAQSKGLFQSDEEYENEIKNKIEKLISSTPDSSITAEGLYPIFTFGTNSTDLQREDTITSIKGKTICWTLDVYEVKRESQGRVYGEYKIQTAGDGKVGTFLSLLTRNEQEKDYVTKLVTHSVITIKGVISRDVMRNIVITPAILSNNNTCSSVTAQSNTANSKSDTSHNSGKSQLELENEQLKRELEAAKVQQSVETPKYNSTSSSTSNTTQVASPELDDFTKVIYGYFSSLTAGNLGDALNYWNNPSIKIKSIIKNAINNEGQYSITDARLMSVANDRAEVNISMTSKSGNFPSQNWRGNIKLIMVNGTDWKISSMDMKKN
jgi:hypothetical protein